MGERWEARKRCYHPDHEYEPPTKKPKLPDLRPSALEQFKKIHEFDDTFPLFAPLCRNHRNTLGENISVTVEDSVEEEYVPDEIESSPKLLDTLNVILRTLGVPPIRSTISSTVDEVSKRFIFAQRQKFELVISKLKNLFGSIAPGQEELFKNILFNDTNPDSKQGELHAYRKVFEAESCSSKRLEILSLIDQNRFTRNEIIEGVGCSRNQIVKARKLYEKTDTKLVSNIRTEKCVEKS